MDQPQIPRPSAGQMMAMSNHLRQFEAGHNAATTTGARAFVGVATAHDDARIEVIAEQHIHHKYGEKPEEKYPVPMDPSLPRHPNPLFTGRKEALEKIDSVFWPRPKNAKGESKDDLETDSTSPVPPAGRKKIALYGLAGAGKSEVALRYAFTHYAKYDAVFRIQVRDAAGLETGASRAIAWIIKYYRAEWDSATPGLCMRIAAALHMSESEDEPRIDDFETLMREASNGRQNIQRLQHWLPSRRPWLLILDNYDDPEACDINSLLPSTNVGHVLITSRSPDLEEMDEKIEIEPSLGLSDSAELLGRKTDASAYCCGEESHCEHAKNIIKTLGGLPLAIDTIGAYIKKQRVTFAHYAENQLPRINSISSRNSNPGPAADVQDSPNVFAVFEESFKKLSQNARELMQLCSFIANTDIPLELLEGTTNEGKHVFSWMEDREAIRKAVVDLRSYSLVSQSVKDRSLSIHSLVHKYASTALLNDEDARRGLARRVVEVVVATFDLGKTIGSEDADSWSYKLRILPHASRCSEILQFDLAPPGGRALDTETRRLTYRLAQGFSQLGHVQGVKTLYELGLRGIEPSSVGAGDLAEVVDMMNSFGVSLRLQADYDEATAWHERAKDFIEKMLPDPCKRDREKDIRVLEVERYMAAILIDQELFDAAKTRLERVLEQQQQQQQRELHVHKNQDKENRNEDATALEIQTQHDLGEILQALGLRDQALEKFKLVHEYRRKKHGDNNAATLEAAHSVAMILEEKGQYSESLALHQENLERRKSYLGEGHYSTLDTMDSIASVYERQGQYEASLQQYREVLVKLERVLFGAAADHPWLLRVRSSLADVELRQGLFTEALEGYSSVYLSFKNRSMNLGGAWPTQTNIARVLRELGQYDLALETCEEALQGLQTGGGDSTFVDAAEFCKATILELQGRFGEALRLYDKTASSDEASLGPDHLETLKTKCFVASVTARLERYEEALRLYDDIDEKLQYRAKEQGHLLVKLLVDHGKADILAPLGECSGALVLYESVCSKREKWKLKDHPEYYRAVHGRGKACFQMGKYDKGLGFLQDAIDGWRCIFRSQDHPLVFTALEDKGNALRQQGGPKSLREAEVQCVEALEGCQRMLLPDDPQTFRVKVSLGAVLYDQGRLLEAPKLCGIGLRGLQDKLGDDHPWTRQAGRTLVGIMWRRRRYGDVCRLSIVAAGGPRGVLAALAPSVGMALGLLTITILFLQFSFGHYVQMLSSRLGLVVSNNETDVKGDKL